MDLIPSIYSSSQERPTQASSSSSSSQKRKLDSQVSVTDLKERASTFHSLCFPVLSKTKHKAPCRIMFHILKDWLRYSKEDIHNKSNELTQLVSERLSQSPQGDSARFELVKSIIKSETNQSVIIRQRCLSPNDTQFKPIKTMDLTTGEEFVIHEELNSNNPRQSVGIKVELNGNGIDSFQTHLKSLAKSTGMRIFELGVYKETKAHSAMIIHDKKTTYIVDPTTKTGVFSNMSYYLSVKNNDFNIDGDSIILNILPENISVEPPLKITKFKLETPIQTKFIINEGNDTDINTKLSDLPKNTSINKLILGNKVTCSNDTLKLIAKKMQGLNVLQLGHNVTCSDDTLKLIAQNMRGLNILNLGPYVTCSDDTLKLIAKNMSGLNILNLGLNVTCSDSTLTLIAKNTVGLRVLGLGNNVICADSTLKLMAQNMVGLKMLNLGEKVMCSDKTLKLMAQNMVGLNNLYLGSYVICSDETLKLIAQNMVGLKMLNFGNKVSCSDDTLKLIAQNMVGLKALYLGNNVTCFDDTLELIAQKMNGLMALQIRSNVICSDNTLKLIAKNMRGLRMLNLGNNVSCSDSTLKMIAQKMRELKLLNLGNNVICSDDTLKLIAQNMSGLKLLNLGNNVICSNDTASDIKKCCTENLNFSVSSKTTISQHSKHLLSTEDSLI